MLTTGFPVNTPVLQASIKPFSTAGMKLVGTEPPNTEFTNSKFCVTIAVTLLEVLICWF